MNTGFSHLVDLSEINSKNYDIILGKVKSTPVTPVTSSSMSEYSDSTNNIKTEIKQQQKHLSNKENGSISANCTDSIIIYAKNLIRVIGWINIY